MIKRGVRLKSFSFIVKVLCADCVLGYAFHKRIVLHLQVKPVYISCQWISVCTYTAHALYTVHKSYAVKFASHQCKTVAIRFL